MSTHLHPLTLPKLILVPNFVLVTPTQLIFSFKNKLYSKNNKGYVYFCQKVLPNCLPIGELRTKILSKQSEAESKLQLKILGEVEKLNVEMSDKKPIDLFHNRACISLYNTILELQVSQHFASSKWKVVTFPILVPMVGKIFFFTAGVFHTRKCELFLSWSLKQKCHPDMNFLPSSNLFSDENVVAQHSPLVEKPTHKTEFESDWPFENSLEMDRSVNSAESTSSSIDSGKTVVKPSVPVMDANDLSHIDLECDETTMDSYLDISFVTPKRRLNLSKKDKIDILDGPSSTHSTPVRLTRPNLSTSFKRTQKPRPKIHNPGYIQKFLDRWFRSQMSNITAEIQNEMDQMK